MSDKTHPDNQRAKIHIEEEATDLRQVDVSGDVVTGDEITVGDVTASRGVAIGRYARAMVNNTSVALGVPAWTVIAAALILALGLMAGAAVLADPGLLPRAPTPMAFAEAQPDETLVIVTKFEDRSEGQKAGVDPARRIYQALYDLAGRSPNIRVEHYLESVSRSEEARKLGSIYNATLVLWGWYDRLGITPVAEAIRVEGTESFFGPEIDISVDERFAFCVRELPTHSSFLSLFTLGQAYFLAPGGKSSGEALDLFTAAIEATPQEPECVVEGTAYQAVALSWAYYYRGGVYYYRGDLDQALSEVNKAIELDPDYARAYRGLGTIYRALGDLEQAEAAYTRGLEREIDSENRVILYTNRGQVYADKGDLESALSDFNEALRLDPTNARGYASRCKMYRLKGELDMALADCNKALELDPDYAWAYSERGLVYKDRDELDEALADYDRATEINPDYAWPYNYRGIIFGGMGKLDEALEQFSKAIELFSDPKDQAIAYSHRCNAYRLKKDFDRALADCDRATELDPTNVLAYDHRASVYRYNGDYDKAIEQISVAIELEPTAKRYNNRGFAYSEQGNYQQAIGDYTRAIEIDPNYSYPYNNRGFAYSSLGEYDLAFQDFERAMEINPDNAWIYYNRGLTYIELGESAKAIADLELSLELNKPPLDEQKRARAEELLQELRGE